MRIREWTIVTCKAWYKPAKISKTDQRRSTHLVEPWFQPKKWCNKRCSKTQRYKRFATPSKSINMWVQARDSRLKPLTFNNRWPQQGRKSSKSNCPNPTLHVCSSLLTISSNHLHEEFNNVKQWFEHPVRDPCQRLNNFSPPESNQTENLRSF